MQLSVKLSVQLSVKPWRTLGTAIAALACLLAPVEAIAQSAIPEATAPARAQQRQQVVRQVRPDNYDLSRHPVTDAGGDFWRNMLWVTALVEPQESYVDTGVAQILGLTNRSNLSARQKRTVDLAMAVGNQLYLSNPTFYERIGQQFAQTLTSSADPFWVGIALSALAKGNSTPEQRQQWSDRVRQRFPNWSKDVYLYSTLQEVQAIDRPVALPPLSDLLNGRLPNQLQMYVLCRPDRGTLCLAVLKNRQGEFVRENGQLWSVPLLLRSVHNLSPVFTRGQTPQGVYRIEGTTPQPDTDYFRAFGLFALVNLFVPYEAGVREFIAGQPGQIKGLAAYQSLLPPSWQNYFPIQQTYWAGKAQRAEFRIHGTGDAPTMFGSNRRYPESNRWNPSIGCLSAIELYDEAGQLQQADMPRILRALTAIGGQNFTGYLVVVDVPGANTPISVEEIEAAIAP